MKKLGIAVTVIFALLALGGSFVGVTAALYITQPAAASSHVTVSFTVAPGDTTASVADHLQQDGLIRNAQLFRVWARYRHLDRGIEPGVYQLTPNMTMDAIILKLQQGKPEEQLAAVPDALRVTQYPKYFATLPNFNQQNFLQIAKTGKLLDGTPLWQKYWFVEQPQKNAVYALEGYLYPDTYYFNASDNEIVVIERMLTEFAEKLCPGPASQPAAYVMNAAQCKANAVKVNGVNIFTAMEQAYFTTNDTQALYDALTVASMTTREIRSYNDASGVASVYHNRYLEYKQKLPDGVSGDTAGYMGADPTVQYARDTLNPPPPNGKWWSPLNGQASQIDCSNPYNTESSCNKGLPPGPIAAPVITVLTAAAAPKDPKSWPNFYFVSDKCSQIHYWANAADFNAQEAAAQNAGNCK